MKKYKLLIDLPDGAMAGDIYEQDSFLYKNKTNKDGTTVAYTGWSMLDKRFFEEVIEKENIEIIEIHEGKLIDCPYVYKIKINVPLINLCMLIENYNHTIQELSEDNYYSQKIYQQDKILNELLTWTKKYPKKTSR